jgi:hypothetical protein
MAKSISKISKELEKLTDDMKKMAKEYGEASGQERQELVKKLKDMTKKKKDLEHELERGVMDLDQDVDLQIDEVRKAIRAIIREELLKKKLNEIEFNDTGSKTDPEVEKGIDAAMAKFMSGFKADVNDIEQTANDTEELERLAKKYPELNKLTKENKLNEEVGLILIFSILAAMPKLIKHLSSVLKWASKFSTGGAGISWVDKFASGMKNFGEAWHHSYIKMVMAVLKAIPAYRKAPHALQEKIAETVWMAIVATLLITSGTGAVKAAQHGDATLSGLETALAAVKRGELSAWLEAELASTLSASAAAGAAKL